METIWNTLYRISCVNIFSINRLIDETPKDCLELQIFLPDECFNLQKALCRAAEVRVRGAAGRARIMARKRQLQLREFTAEEENVFCSPTLQVACLAATGAHYLFFFPDTELKNALWENPSWHMTQCKGRSQREAASRGWHGLDALGHSTGSPGWVALPTEARVQFAQFSWELPVKPQVPVNWAKEESKDPAPRLETHKGRHFKRSLVKRRKNYTQILEENWNGFKKRI